MPKILFVLFVYDSEECSTGHIEGVYLDNDNAQDAGEAIIEGTDNDYYVVARKLQ